MSMSKVLLNCHTYLLPRIRGNKNKPWWFQRQDFHACVQYSNWSWNWNVLKWVTKYWKVAGEISCGDNSYHSKSVVFVVKIQSSEGTFQQICNKLWKDKWRRKPSKITLFFILFVGFDCTSDSSKPMFTMKLIIQCTSNVLSNRYENIYSPPLPYIECRIFIVIYWN